MARYVIVRDGVVQLVSTTLSEFLLEFPRGAYTVMRTINQCQKIVCFDYHVRRLSSSAYAMVHEGLHADLLANDLLQNIRLGISAISPKKEDLTIAVLIPTEGYEDKSRESTWIHISPFHHMHSTTVMVEAVKASRKQFGTTKDSLWVKIRQDLIRMKHPDADEIVIVDDDDSVLEGLSSNVYVVTRQNQIQTAPISDGIVAGTIREVLLQACRKHGVAIIEETPLWKDRFQWQGVFLTSTSRLVLPVHKVLDSVTQGDPLEFTSIPDIVQKCRDFTESNIEEFCRDIYGDDGDAITSV